MHRWPLPAQHAPRLKSHKRFALGYALLLLASCQTPAPNRAKIPPVTLKAYLMGHWFQEVHGDEFNRFEIDYSVDGSVTAYQFRPVYHDTIPTAVPLVYRGMWQIIGTRLIHKWKPDTNETSLGIDECEILELTPKTLRMRDTQFDELMNFYRKFTLAHTQ
jgi:hypothetical protein